MRYLLSFFVTCVAIMCFAVPALAQECGTGCVAIIDLAPECVPVEPDICPLQAFPSHDELCVSWLNDDGTYNDDVAHCWQQTPYATEYLANNPMFAYPMIGEGLAPASSSEWGCGIVRAGVAGAGELACFGNAGILTGYPTGEAPYSALSSGGVDGRFAVLNNVGAIKVWGVVTNGFGSPPTSTGFTELGVGFAAGCAVGIANGGVSCWGSDQENLVVNSSKPSSGTYTAVEVGRTVAGAVQDDGTLDMWGSSRAGSATLVAEFIANRPTGTNVKSFEVGETGRLIGVAWMTDGTAYIWQDNGSLSNAIRHAPGWYPAGGTGIKTFVPHGPNGNITFRSRLEIAANDVDAQICGVIDDPKGLMTGDSVPVAYQHGDVVCWAQNGDWPRIEAFCVPAQ